MTIRRPSFASLALAAVVAGAPASAAPSLDVPAGPLGTAILELGRQSGTSIAVADARLWGRRVPALRGAMPVDAALIRLAAAAGAVAVPVGPGAWRLEPRRRGGARRPAPAASPPSTEAQEAAPGDILVTASKRDLPLNAYAGQVTRLDGADLTLGGTGGTDAVVARLATLTSTHLGSGRNKLFIRGIADSGFTGPTQATVGQYLGDLRLGYNAPDPDLKLYDVAAVEVLEGPQGTLYGAGSLGGIIRVDPAPAVPGVAEGSAAIGASATAHGDPGADGAAMLNLPLAGEALTLRAVGYGVTEGGYIDNPALGRRDINRTKVWGGRATLRLASEDGWTVDLAGVGQRTSGEDSQYADRDGPPLTRASQIQQGFAARYLLGQVVVAKTWDGLSLRSTTGLVRQRLGEAYEATVPRGLVLPGAGSLRAVNAAGAILSSGQARLFTQRNDTRLLAHETRLWRPMADGFGWVLGASATRNRTRLSRSLSPLLLAAPVAGVTNRISELTLYGEGSVSPHPAIVVTGGARLTHARLEGVPRDLPLAVLGPARAAAAARTEASVLPTASVIATVAPGASLFARYQQGFRPGGLAAEGAAVRRFGNDRIRTLEAGLRLGRPGGPADLTASLSRTRWTDIQADFLDNYGLPSTANIGDGRIWTLSAAGGWSPLPGLRVDLAGTYNDSEVSHPAAFLPLDAVARGRVPNVARVSGRAGFDLQAELAGQLPLRLTGWARYIGRSRLGIGPILGDLQGNYVDTAAHARIGGPFLGLTLSLTNVADTVGNRFALGTPFAIGRPQVTPLRPRTVRIGLDAGF